MKKLATMFLVAVMVTTSIGLNHINVTAEEQTEEVTESDTRENQNEEEVHDPEEGDHANSWRYSEGVEVASEKEENTVSTQAVNITQQNITRMGIDVSEHNGDIDWAKVKEDGVEFAIIRCGYGQDRTDQDDKKWLRNVEACERLGIPYGVYIYSYATNTTRAAGEANHVLRLIKGHHLSYPVYFDMEDSSTENSDLTGMAKVFCEKIQNAGYPVGVYSSLNWWNTKLTDSCFQNWYRWIASWSVAQCKYDGDFALWQYSESGTVAGISGNVDMNYLIGSPADHGDPVEEPVPDEVKNTLDYEAHVSDIGWQGNVKGGMTAGTVGKNRGIEALKIISNVENVGVKYTSYTKAGKWQDYTTDGTVTGSVGNARSLEAVKIELTGEEKENYNIYYRVHVSDFGWLDWTKDGIEAGTVGYGKKIEAIQIRLLAKNSEYIPETGENACKVKSSGIGYQADIQGSGWQNIVENGAISGTVGKNKGIEAFKIALQNPDVSGSVEYRAHVSDIGWQDYVSEDSIEGTTGKNKRVEAIAVRLTGEMAEKYDIYYRVHSADFGWLGWTKNGESAGSEGFGKQVEAFQIQLVKKGDAAPGSTENAFKKKVKKISYQAHVENIGWQKYVSDGEVAGTTGQAKQIEAIRIRLDNKQYNGNIEYRAHVADYGWQKYVSEGELAGTTGKDKQIEAVSMKLTGEMAEKYDIYYRVHSADFGWLGWAKNGENAGSTGYGKRIEAIQIELAEKGSAFSGSTKNSFYVK